MALMFPIKNKSTATGNLVVKVGCKTKL